MLRTQQKFFLVQLQRPLSWVELLNRRIVYFFYWILNRVQKKKKILIQLQQRISWVELLNKKIAIEWVISGWMISWLFTLK